MIGGKEEDVSVEYFNCWINGFFQRETVERGGSFTGPGIVVDDEFNFFISDWKEGRMNGLSFVRLSGGQMIYGLFEKNIPKGAVAIVHGKYKMFLGYQYDKKQTQSWRRESVLIDTQSRIFYMLELTPRQQQKQADLDRTQKIGSETMRYQNGRGLWRIKIIDRCPLKSDGRLSGYSKKIKGLDRHVDVSYNKSEYTVEQQNHIELITKVMGELFNNVCLISPSKFILLIADSNPKFMVRQQGVSSSDQALFLSLSQQKSGVHRSNQNRLGLVIGFNPDFVKSLGSYDGQGNLNGMGVQLGRYGDSYVGVYRENLLIKEYVHNKQASKVISTVQIRQLLKHEHMKSINYVHNCHYISQMQMIAKMGERIAIYVLAFEREFQKKHFSYNDTEELTSMSSEGMNVLKYAEESKDRNVQYIEEQDVSEREFKKPGFILSKKSKSRQRQNSRSPVTGNSKSPQPRSPLNANREVGKITRGYSPLRGSTATGLRSTFAYRKPY